MAKGTAPNLRKVDLPKVCFNCAYFDWNRGDVGCRKHESISAKAGTLVCVTINTVCDDWHEKVVSVPVKPKIVTRKAASSHDWEFE